MHPYLQEFEELCVKDWGQRPICTYYFTVKEQVASPPRPLAVAPLPCVRSSLSTWDRPSWALLLPDRRSPLPCPWLHLMPGLGVSCGLFIPPPVSLPPTLPSFEQGLHPQAKHVAPTCRICSNSLWSGSPGVTLSVWALTELVCYKAHHVVGRAPRTPPSIRLPMTPMPFPGRRWRSQPCYHVAKQLLSPQLQPACPLLLADALGPFGGG